MTVQNAKTVCVTGAAGFIASWLVKLLLERGYTVRGTVRNPDDEKNAHLRSLMGAKERLVLMKADLIDYESINNAVKGCDGVFHTACPVLIQNFSIIQEAAISGTINVLKACTENKVGRVVVTSSICAVYMDPSRPLHQVVNEDCWSDIDHLQATKDGYCLAKTLAERAAWEYAKQNKLEMVVVNPSLVLGPLLQSTMNASTTHILKYLTGSAKTYINRCQAYVDVRDLADAFILVYETPSACGRYICADCVLHRGDLVDLLADMYPQYPLPRKCSDETNAKAKPYIISSKKLKDLGFKFMPFRQCLEDTVTSLQQKGFLT